MAKILGAVAALALLGGLTWLGTRLQKSPGMSPAQDERILIAVLPFENLGPPADEYFADGVTEEISGRLATVSELGVISRTSTRHFEGSGKPVKEIARELGVDYVLEGTVRWDRSGDVERVLITPQLIRVADDTYVWSEQYDRVLHDLFRTQSEIAGRVIKKLDVTLLASARQRIESPPTRVFEAYQAYLRGLESTRTSDYSEPSLRLAVSMFERAVALDPDFAQAHAELSRVHSRAYHLGFDRTAERLARAKESADRAVALDAGLAQTRLALAYYYYWGLKDYTKALQELDATKEETRNNVAFLEARGYILRRQGEYAAAAENLLRALELSPRDASLAVEVANTHLGLWQFERARRYYDLAIALAPDRTGAYTLKVRNQYLWDADLDAARAILDAMPARESTRVVWFHAFHSFFERDYGAVIDQLAERRGEIYQTHAQAVPMVLVIAWAHEKLGDRESARKAYGEALALLEEARRRQPDDFRIQMALALAHAGLEHREEALRLGDRAVELYPISKDAWAGPIVARNHVILLARAGEYAAALEQVRTLLSFPNPGASPALFRIDPRLDELREQPGFLQALERAALPAP